MDINGGAAERVPGIDIGPSVAVGSPVDGN